MKISLIKEKKENGTCIYFTEVDGSFISGSLKTDKEEAEKMFQNIINNKGKSTSEVLKSIEL